MDALEFNKQFGQYCKDKKGDCENCDMRLYCYLSPSERPQELISLVLSILHNHSGNQNHYSHHSAASYPCICNADMSNAPGCELLQ